MLIIRRLAAAVAAGLALLALAPMASAAPKVVPADKVFPYLENYLKLPAVERSRFSLAYYFTMDGKPPAGLSITAIDGATRSPIPLGPDGRVQRLPNLDQLQRVNIEVARPETAKVQLSLSIQPATPMGVEVDARELALSIDQARSGVKKAAGVMGFAAPKMERIYFRGVPGGEAILANGGRVALPVVKGMVMFDPVALPQARTLKFPKPPARADIGPAV